MMATHPKLGNLGIPR
uniref:Uncharacterized protein n=1 Tax=Arundo donax TaxID=35708 RepID=A0A0A8ZYA8_ARUDO